MELELVYLIIVSVLALISFIGLPGPSLIAITALAYGIQTGFSTMSTSIVIGFILLGVLSIFIDNMMALVGAKKFGASKYGIYGAFAGLVSVFIIGPFGILLGPPLGAFIGELVFSKRSLVDSSKAAIGTIVGFFAGLFAKALLGVAMAIWFYTILY